MYNCLDRPLPPTQVSVHTVEGTINHQLNISWTPTTVTGVNQTYIIVFEDYTIQTASTYHTFYREITSADPSRSCGLFLAYVITVNGAGESDPSNNVSIPSLPDIRPVTDSFTHQIWKYNGEIRVNISFQVRCYKLKLVHVLMIAQIFSPPDSVWITLFYGTSWY